jgi:hypothetical protein
MGQRRQTGLELLVSHMTGMDSQSRALLARHLLAEAQDDAGIRPRFDVHTIARHQRAALTWRLRDILALPGDIDAAHALRGGLLALIAELEGASPESLEPLFAAPPGASS